MPLTAEHVAALEQRLLAILREARICAVRVRVLNDQAAALAAELAAAVSQAEGERALVDEEDPHD